MAGCRASRTALWVFGAALLAFAVVAGVFFGVILKNDGEHEHGTPDTSSPELTISQGALRGEWVAGAQGRGFRYAAFRGIPYAKPPVGGLRFKGPRDTGKWTGVLNATKEGSMCYQSASGSEDCLYLNVYTPKLPSAHANPGLPVYVYIHGGVFQFGSASAQRFGPDFLVQQDIIVVTMNYRLGFLGYMSLDTDDVPGNIGLKDAVQALRWVQRNIRSFGGDPSKVTLGGQSSGGVSASWLTLLPATKGLLRSAIIQSGTAVSSWGTNSRHVEFAETVFRLLTGRAAGDRAETAKALMEADVRELFFAAENATDILHKTKSLGSDISFFYLPTLETRESSAEPKLITKDAESYVIRPETDPIPIMLGETMREWAQFFLMGAFADPAVIAETIPRLESFVPASIAPGPNTSVELGLVAGLDAGGQVDALRDYYFGQNRADNCDDSCRMAKYLDHIYIMADTSHMARLRARHCPAPTYLYVFNFKSEYGANTTAFPDYLRDAVIHGDDLSHSWMRWGAARDYYGDGRAARGLRRQVALLANFIKEGDPTPRTDDLLTLRWRPVRQGEQETFLEINDDLVQHAGSAEGDDAALWTRVFTEMRDGKGV